MARHWWDGEHWVEHPPRDYSKPLGVMIQGDLKPYVSPLGTGVVDGRRARREEMKRHNCREVEPSEFRPSYSTKEEKAKRAESQAQARAASAAQEQAFQRGLVNGRT